MPGPSKAVYVSVADERGVPTRRGCSWHGTSLSNVIKRPGVEILGSDLGENDADKKAEKGVS